MTGRLGSAGLIVAVGVGLIFAVPLVPAAGQNASQQAAPGVQVVTVAPQPFERQSRFVGNVTSPAKVDVVSRVKGYIEKKVAADGSSVKEGDLLFTIDAAPYQAQLDLANAKLASAVAAEELANVTYKRSLELLARGTVPQAKVDTDRATLDEAKAATEVAQANVALAKLQVSYTQIMAPMNGRLGTAAYAKGELVSPSSKDPINTLVSIDPMRVTFAVPQRIYLNGRLRVDAGDQLKIQLVMANGALYDQTGKLLYTDVVANSTTDSVNLIAQFPNPKDVLIDGQVVDVLITDQTQTKVIALAESTILRDIQGPYVLTVNADNVVTKVRVQTGARSGQNIVVTSGLRTGDRVVVSGIMKARPGSRVTPHEATPKATTSPPGTPSAAPTAGGTAPSAKTAPSPNGLDTPQDGALETAAAKPENAARPDDAAAAN